MINQPKLHLACGKDIKFGYWNIDKSNIVGIDAVMDLETFPWDIESNSADEVICNHYIEHTPMETYAKRLIQLINQVDSFFELQKEVKKIDLEDPSDGLILFMEELYRILKPTGVANIITPYYQAGVAWQDPTHRRAITEETFKYFNKGWRERSLLDHYGINTNFQTSLKGYELYDGMTFESNDIKKFAMRSYNNVIFAMHTELIKLS